MKTTYLFPALLGACFVLFGSSDCLQAQDGPTPPDSTDAPIDPVDGQPPQGPNNPQQPPANPDICGVVVDPKFVCEYPAKLKPAGASNMKCKDRGRCGPQDPVTGKQPCIKLNDNFLLLEYVGEAGKEEYQQVQAAPNGPQKKLYTDETVICYKIYECESECIKSRLGVLRCVRKEHPKEKLEFHKFNLKGDCPEAPINPGPPKPDVVPDLN